MFIIKLQKWYFNYSNFQNYYHFIFTEIFLDLDFNENTMNIACGVLKKFDTFLYNCYNYLNTIRSCKHVPDPTLLRVRKLYIITNILLMSYGNNYFRKLMILKIK